MSIRELEEKLIADGFKICPICGVPFKPHHSRQKTCGSAECKREYKNSYMRESRKRQKEETPDEYRRYRREEQLRYRHKKAELKRREEALLVAAGYWSERDIKESRVSGLDYGKRSAERLLASIQKIDTEIESEDS